jgi:hypothetical protein
MTSTTNDSSFASPRHAQFWAGKELWSFFELQVICCHIVPHLPETLDLTDGEGYADELLEARQTIERGVYAKTLKYMPQPGSGNEAFSDVRSCYFRPIDVADWAVNSHIDFPAPLIKEILASRPADKEETLLSKSCVWSNLEKLANEAIHQYPAWSQTQERITKTGNLQEWLTKTLGADTRQAVIIGNVLTELFFIR